MATRVERPAVAALVGAPVERVAVKEALAAAAYLRVEDIPGPVLVATALGTERKKTRASFENQ